MISRQISLIVLCIAALATLLAGCRNNQRRAEILNGQGNQQYSAGDFAAALETYRQAEVLRPDLPAISYNAANALNHQNDFTRSIDEDQRAARSTDATIQNRAYYGMADGYTHMNQLREAIDAYKSALRADPSDVDAKYNLEVVERQLDQQQAEQAQQQSQAQQSGQSQATQSGQAEHAQAGQPSGDQNEQAEAAQAAQAAQGAQAAQAAQANQAQPGPGQQASAQSGAASGYTGTPEGQAQALEPDLKRALDRFNQTGNIDDALRALDIAAQQERLRQSGSGAPPDPKERDW
jgi:Ca-activated chloride channel family protein